MLVRVERTGKEQRDSGFVHAEDAREYLQDKLGVKGGGNSPQDFRKRRTWGAKTSLRQVLPVRYIITKDALREGWDCPFAYVLAILSKTTANTALTQMIGRVLRQPHAQLTHRPALDECYVYTFDQDVTDAVKMVRKGLQSEGMGDLAASVKVADADGGAKRITRREILLRREAFARLPTIFLPRVLHRDDGTVAGFRLLDYDRDILGDLDWSGFRFLQAGNMAIEDVEKLKRTIARVDLDKKTDETGLFTHELVAEVPDEGLDLPFLVRQLLDVIPNPWQGMRILNETLATLRSRG